MANGMNQLEIKEIMELLPHRYPFLLVDRVTDYTAKESIQAYKNVSVNEPCFTGHFPDKPIFPGVLILEGMAQVAGILGFKSVGNTDDLYLYAGIDNARFKLPVVPGDKLEFEVKFVKERRGIWKFSGVASVDGKDVCTADFMCALRKM